MKNILIEFGVPRRDILTVVGSATDPLRVIPKLQDRGRLGPVETAIMVACPTQTLVLSCWVRCNLYRVAKLLYCPHQEFCTASTWAQSEHYRRYVLSQLAQLIDMERRGLLPPGWLDSILNGQTLDGPSWIDGH
jgi:hypothetical protein